MGEIMDLPATHAELARQLVVENKRLRAEVRRLKSKAAARKRELRRLNRYVEAIKAGEVIARHIVAPLTALAPLFTEGNGTSPETMLPDGFRNGGGL